MRFASIVLVGCVAQTPTKPTPTITNRALPALGPLPCGANAIAELDPERPKTSSCTVVKHRLFDGTTLVVESHAHRALIAFDSRVPGPHGIRVGHTGRDVERLAPEYTDIKCNQENRTTKCLLESSRDQELDCDNTGVGGITLHFEWVPEARVPCCGWALVGARARDVLRDRAVVAVQVRNPYCSGD